MTRDQKQIVLDFFRVTHRPVHVGEMACVLGMGLAETSDLFMKMVTDGTIRPVNETERCRYDLHDDAAAFVLKSNAG